MKLHLLLAFTACLISKETGTAQTADLSPQSIVDLSWTNDMQPDFIRTYPFTGSVDAHGLYIGYQSAKAIDVPLRTFGPAIASNLTLHKFGITGRLKYTDLPAGSYIELVGTFGKPEDNQTMSVETSADSGPNARIEGTDQGRDLRLTLDATGSPFQGLPLNKVSLNLHLAGGPCAIDLLGLKLVQFPDAAHAVKVPPAITAPNLGGSLILNLGRAGTATTYTVAGGSYADIAAVRDFLMRQHEANSRVSLIIRASQDVPYNDIVQVLDAAKDANIVQVAFATQTAAAVPAPDVSTGKDLYRFGWPDWFADQPHPSMEVDPQTGSLFLKYWGEKPADLEVQRVELNVLSTLETNQFAVEGHLQYKKVAPGSYLEMWTIFEPEKPGDPPPAYCTRTLADSGPLQALSGDSESRAFQIPFDITGAKTHLKRVLVRLHLAGGFGTTLSIDDATISQFPNGTFPATVASLKTVTPTSPPLLASFNPTSSSPSPALATSRGMAMVDGRSFLLGAAATSLALLIFFALVHLFRLLRRRHHERELRRIASLDT